MSNESTKEILLTVLSICVLVISVVGVTYAVYDSYAQPNVLTNVTKGTIIYQYNENNDGFYAGVLDSYNVNNLLTLEDTHNTFKFNILYNSKDNIASNYEINITDITAKEVKSIETKFIKVLLTEVKNNKEIIVLDEYYDRLPTSSTRKNSKILKTDSIDNRTSEKRYKVRLYIASSLNKEKLEFEEDVVDETGNILELGNKNSKFEAKISVVNY